MYLCVSSRWDEDDGESEPGFVRPAAPAAGQAAWEGVEAGGHLPGPGHHPGSEGRRDHAEAAGVGGVEEKAAAGEGHGVTPATERKGTGWPSGEVQSNT